MFNIGDYVNIEFRSCEPILKSLIDINKIYKIVSINDDIATLDKNFNKHKSNELESKSKIHIGLLVHNKSYIRSKKINKIINHGINNNKS